MIYPNFTILGPPKTGSTSLFNYLSQHTEIYASPMKEPRFFLFDHDDPETRIKMQGLAKILRWEMVWNMAQYKGLFDGVKDEKAVGEGTVSYLAAPGTPQRLYDYNPDMKLIVVLRQPADRAYSHYAWRRTSAVEKAPTFSQALHEERTGLREDWYIAKYLPHGFYYKLLTDYLYVFPREQISIHLFEDFIDNPTETCRGLCTFLGVDPNFTPNVSKVWNISGSFSNRLLQRSWEKSLVLRDVLRPYMPRGLRHQLYTTLTSHMTKTPFPPREREELTDYYRDDILQLQQLLGRDLTHWLEPE